MIKQLAVIAIGTTGTGKSSLIKLFCGNAIPGDGTSSQTLQCELYRQLRNNDIYWLDTKGANSSDGADDETVLRNILKKLYDDHITNIKVIWCVSGDMCRERQEFQTQARFIRSLGNDVWNSCLIIQKLGKPKPKKISGVLAAARRYGANITEECYHRLFGFKALEYGDFSDDDHLQDINEIENVETRQAKYKRSGYFTNDQIVTEVNHKLSQLPALEIEFEIKQCHKCIIRGDPRFIHAPCHPRSESYHPLSQLV